MRMLPLIVLPAVTLAALSGCMFVPQGPPVSESREIDVATSVVLNTSGDITIREGEPSLIVTAPSSTIERLTSSVVGGVLVLDTERGLPGFLVGKVSYEITLPSLEGLEINGSGNINSDVPSGSSLRLAITGSGDLAIKAIDADNVTLDIVGSGDVELIGRTDVFEVMVSGSGDVRAEELDSARVSVDIDGSGDVAVAASATLTVSISGSGDVVYAGRPEVTQSIAGAGSVSPR